MYYFQACKKLKEQNLLKLGLVGAIVAAVCCFTPVLVVVLGLAGLSAAVGGLDYLLFPALFSFLGVICQALYLRSGRRGLSPRNAIVVLVITLSSLLFWFEFRFALAVTVAAAAMVVGYLIFLNIPRNKSTA